MTVETITGIFDLCIHLAAPVGMISSHGSATQKNQVETATCEVSIRVPSFLECYRAKPIRGVPGLGFRLSGRGHEGRTTISVFQ